MFKLIIFSLNHNLILFSEKNYKKQAPMFYQNYSVETFCITYSQDILQFSFKKSLDLDLENLRLISGFRLTLWYIGLGLKKYLNYLIGCRLILWYNVVTLEKYLDYFGFRLILWYIGLRLEKHLDWLTGLRLAFWWPSRDTVRSLKTYFNYLLTS